MKKKVEKQQSEIRKVINGKKFFVANYAIFAEFLMLQAKFPEYAQIIILTLFGGVVVTQAIKDSRKSSTNSE